jgi:hypothetical protein
MSMSAREKLAMEYLEEYEHFILFMPHEAAVSEIARQYGVIEHTVKSRLSAARRAMTRELTAC